MIPQYNPPTPRCYSRILHFSDLLAGLGIYIGAVIIPHVILIFSIFKIQQTVKVDTVRLSLSHVLALIAQLKFHIHSLLESEPRVIRVHFDTTMITQCIYKARINIPQQSATFLKQISDSACLVLVVPLSTNTYTERIQKVVHVYSRCRCLSRQWLQSSLASFPLLVRVSFSKSTRITSWPVPHISVFNVNATLVRVP